MNQTDFWTVTTIFGLALVTLVTRSFFLFSAKPWRLPAWAERGLNYAPIAALAAVVIPEIVMTRRADIDRQRRQTVCHCSGCDVFLLAQGSARHHRVGYGGVPAAPHEPGVVNRALAVVRGLVPMA